MKIDPRTMTWWDKLKIVWREIKCVFWGVAILAACGCANAAMHGSGGDVRAFGGTRECCKFLAVPFAGAEGAEAAQLEAYATILFPFAALDLPFEIAADAVTLPYDLAKGE